MSFTDPMGLAVYVVCHVAASPLGYVTSPTSFHCAIDIVPDNPAISTLTIGGQPSDGNLVYRPNYSGDSECHAQTKTLVQTPNGLTDNQFIINLIQAAASYNNNLPYSFPTNINGAMPPGTYNSNSVVSGVINAAGGTPPSLPVSTPGYGNPIPLGGH